MQKFEKNDIVKRITPQNYGQLLKILYYTNGTCDDIIRVIPLYDLKESGKPFNIKEYSVTKAKNIDKIRNLSDERLQKILKKSSQISSCDHEIRKLLDKKY